MKIYAEEVLLLNYFQSQLLLYKSYLNFILQQNYYTTSLLITMHSENTGYFLICSQKKMWYQ